MAENKRVDLFAMAERQVVMAVAVQWPQPLLQSRAVGSQVEHVRNIGCASDNMPQRRGGVQSSDTCFCLRNLLRAGEVGLGQQDAIGHRHLAARLWLTV